MLHVATPCDMTAGQTTSPSPRGLRAGPLPLFSGVALLVACLLLPAAHGVRVLEQAREPAGVPLPYCTTQEESRALLAWLAGMNGQGQARSSSEDSDDSSSEAIKDACTLDGIECAPDGHIASILLQESQLSGPLPRGLSCFGQLKALNLGANQFDGPVPAQYSLLTSLEILMLHENALSSSLPHQFSTLSRMTVAHLNHNALTGTLPGTWSSLRLLETAILEDNNLSGQLPEAWSALESLSMVDVGDNELTGTLPDAWSNLRSLATISIDDNSFIGQLPEAWSTMELLSVLDVKASGLATVLPASWNLTQLTSLELGCDDGSCDGEIDIFSLPTSLKSLDLNGIGLSGPIPTGLTVFTGLKELELSGNYFTGTLPSELSVLTTLEEIEITENRGALTGTLPLAWSTLNNLIQLELGGMDSGCVMSATFPTAWSTLTSMEEFLVNHLSVPGKVPVEYTTWASSLKEFDLSDNLLTGAIPSDYSLFSSLEILMLHSNSLTGTLPPEYSVLYSLREMSLHHNLLAGPLPHAYGSMLALTDISLESNSLSGTFPEAWLKMPQIASVQLSANSLTGSIPPSIGLLNPGGLRSLHLGGQQISGPIPESISALSNLEELQLHSAQLTGTIPASLSSMTLLQDLSLSRNFLTGSVPAELCALSNLEQLRLFGNLLTGSIPTQCGLPLSSVCGPSTEDADYCPNCHPATPMCQCAWTSQNKFCGSTPEPLLSSPELDGTCFTGVPCPETSTSIAAEAPGPASGGLLILTLSVCFSAVLACAGIALYMMWHRNPPDNGNPAYEAAAQASKSSLGIRVTIPVPLEDADPSNGSRRLSGAVGSEQRNSVNSQIPSLARKSSVGAITGFAQSALEDEPVKVLELLGVGGCARVYKALWRGAMVALKVQLIPEKPECMAEESKRAHLVEMEAAIAASMCHPNVVQTYSYEMTPMCTRTSLEIQAANSADDRALVDLNMLSSIGNSSSASQSNTDNTGSKGSWWQCRIIQEFCSGGSLSTCLRAGRLSGQIGPATPPSLAVALNLAYEIAAGMHHVHAMKILHGDLKACNILLQQTGRGVTAKVSDFGLAMAIEDEQTHVSGVSSGTVTHMSPELLQHRRQSRASDVYSYGILLYEIFSGKRAWKGLTSAEIISSVISEGKRPSFPITTPVKIIALANSCWAQDPACRPTFEGIMNSLDLLQDLNGRGLLVPPMTRAIRVSSDGQCEDDTSSRVSSPDAAAAIRELQMQGSFSKPS